MAALCLSCGAPLPASGRCRDLFDELSAFTLTRAGGVFIHQHAVDAYAAQHAAENPKPIATAAAGYARCPTGSPAAPEMPPRGD